MAIFVAGGTVVGIDKRLDMDSEDANTPTTRLLTLLNVSALKSKRHCRPSENPSLQPKLNKRRKSIKFAGGDASRPILHPQIDVQSENGIAEDTPVITGESVDADPTGALHFVYLACLLSGL